VIRGKRFIPNSATFVKDFSVKAVLYQSHGRYTLWTDCTDWFGEMKILVCVKQIPQLDAGIRIDAAGLWVEFVKSHPFVMNRFDEFAVEEAVRIKESDPGVTIDAISVGPLRAEKVIRRSMGMGADHGIHVITESEGFISPLDTASWIASVAERKAYDLILTGAMSEDAMQGQVGPMLAELLGMPWATSTIFAQVSLDSGTLYAEREMEGGVRECLELDLPALLTLQSGINRPRYPSLSNMLRANKQALEIIEVGSGAADCGKEHLVRLKYPEKSRAGWILDGSAEEKADRLLAVLRDRAFIA
jgi:electron transfer flavoprotein beta subunit